MAGPCSVCDLVRGRPPEPVQVLHRDRVAVTWLARTGVVVAPVRHAEAVVGDFSVADYLALQRRVHEVGTAVAAIEPTGRLHVRSQGPHVRWHLVPLPPGVPDPPLDLDLPSADQEHLAAEIRKLLA